MKKILSSLVAFASVLLGLGCGIPKGPTTLSMQAKDWDLDPQFNYFPGNPQNSRTLHPNPLTQGFYVDFPVETNWSGCNSQLGTYAGCFLMGYLTTNYGGLAQHQLSMTFQVDTTGSPTFNYMGPQFPGNQSADASVTVMLERAGDDLAHDLWRWYAIGSKVFLAPGQFTVIVPLDVSDWDNVNGSYTLAEREAGFADVLANLGKVGVVFGGGCCAGHGVDVSNGTARFTLLDYTIQ